MLAAVVLFYKGCINRLFVSWELWTNGLARRELPRSGEKKNIVLVASLCFVWCEVGGKMGQYFDKSPILGGNAANGGYCYELVGVSGPRSNHCDV